MKTGLVFDTWSTKELTVFDWIKTERMLSMVRQCPADPRWSANHNWFYWLSATTCTDSGDSWLEVHYNDWM